MVIRRHDRTIAHHCIVDLPSLLSRGDCLVLNDTRVLPARLFGKRTQTGGRWEGLFLNAPEPGVWRIIGETRGTLTPGETLTIHPAHDNDNTEQLILELLRRDDEGVWLTAPQSDSDAVSLLDRFGTLPLPPYIGRRLASENDRDRYQTTFAREPGAIAAPTAGLHVTPALLRQCTSAGIDYRFVTLHVGIGTFRPVSTDRIEDHVMHAEHCRIDAPTARDLETVREQGGRVVAVGTTTVRTLESASQSGRLQAFAGETDIFIRPTHAFQTVDALLTNFHLPKSTLLMLVAAFADLDLMKQAYQEAIRRQYRFYSYGDAMLIL